jgi:hypothetical protein
MCSQEINSTSITHVSQYTYCDIYEGSLDTRQQLSLNNVNKQMLRDNNTNRRRNNEADVTQENRSITMDTRVKKIGERFEVNTSEG